MTSVVISFLIGSSSERVTTGNKKLRFAEVAHFHTTTFYVHIMTQSPRMTGVSTRAPIKQQQSTLTSNLGKSSLGVNLNAFPAISKKLVLGRRIRYTDITELYVHTYIHEYIKFGRQLALSENK